MVTKNTHTEEGTHQGKDKKAPGGFLQFDELPDSAFVQIRVVAAVSGVSLATVYRMVERGTLPKPKKVSARASRWNVGELRSSLAAL